MTPLSDTILDRLLRTYGAARDPARAVPMRAYMRDQFPYLGIPAPARATLDRQITRGLPALAEADLVALALACWDLPEREYQYFAVRLLRRGVGRCSPALLPHAETLITTRSWWDTVDELATHVVGALVLAHRELGAVMDEWVAAENIWLARTAILHQERWSERTDPEVLFAYCAACRRSGVLPAQGDRLGVALLRPGGPGGRAGLRRRPRRRAVGPVETGGAAAPGRLG